jgi:hypothetical protein
MSRPPPHAGIGRLLYKVGKPLYKVGMSLKDKDLTRLKDKDTKRQRTVKTDSSVGVRGQFVLSFA